MPYTIRKVSKKNCYKVTNSRSKRVMSKCTTRRKAERQKRLLNAILNNKNFVIRARTKTKKRNLNYKI